MHAACNDFAVFRFIGTEGHITGTLGAMYNYPDGRPDTLQWSSTRYYPEKRFEAKLEGKWIPDAFIGPTASLMQAIHRHRSLFYLDSRTTGGSVAQSSTAVLRSLRPLGLPGEPGSS